MQAIVPSSAVQSGIIAGTVAYLVVNTAGEITGFFISRAATGAAAIAGGVATVLAGSIAGTITQEAVRGATDGWFLPVVRSGGRFGAIGAAAGVGAATVLAVTLAYHSGRYVIKTIQTLRGRGDSSDGSETVGVSVDFTVAEENNGEFAVISLSGGDDGQCGDGDG